MSVATYCYVAVCSVAVGSAARGASAPTEGGEGRGHIVAAACLQLVLAVNERNSYGCSCQIRGLLAFVAALRCGNSYSNGRIQSSSRCLLACSARLLALRVVSRLCALSCGGDFFLPRDAMHKRGLCCCPVSVCPSRWWVDCIPTAKDIVYLLSRSRGPSF